METSKPAATPPIATPTLKRRLICLVYDSILIAAVTFFGMFVFTVVFQKMNENFIFYGRQVALFLVAGAYFIHSWTGSGHTLAMKTWRIKIVKLGYKNVPFRSALVRYVLAWGWVFPALAISQAFHLTRPQTAAAVGVGMLLWSLTAFLDKDRQFLHDKVAGTRLISLPNRRKGDPVPA